MNITQRLEAANITLAAYHSSTGMTRLSIVTLKK